jgi:hypothetical protein
MNACGDSYTPRRAKTEARTAIPRTPPSLAQHAVSLAVEKDSLHGPKVLRLPQEDRTFVVFLVGECGQLLGLRGGKRDRIAH